MHLTFIFQIIYFAISNKGLTLFLSTPKFPCERFSKLPNIFWQFSVTCSAFYGSDIANFVPFVTLQLILSNADVQNSLKEENKFDKLNIYLFKIWSVVVFEGRELTLLSNEANFPCWLLLLILQFCQLCLWQT